MDNQNQPSSVPTPPPLQNKPPLPIDPEKRFKFLEKMVEVDLFLNLIVGGIVLFIIIFIIAWRFDVLNYFQKKAGTIPENVNKQARKDLTFPEIVEASTEKGESPVYINQQGVDLDKAFKASPGNLKLTVNGQLKKEVLGFLPYWAVPKLDELSTKLLTSLSYFGLEVDGNGNVIKTDSTGKVIEPWYRFQSDLSVAKFFNNAKKDRIKVFVTLKCFNQQNIVNLVTNQKAADNFITNAIYLVNSKSLDGVNIDFEYIGTPPQNVIDGFSAMMIKLNKELKREYPKAELTIDTFVDAAANKRIHDIPILAHNSDALVIMGYDFSTPGSGKPGPLAPMEGNGYSIVSFIGSYLEKAPAEKIVLAVPYYGYDWPVGSDGGVLGGKADVKILSYAEMADIKSNKINWDETAQSPWYSYVDKGQKRTVYFENPRSLGIKYDYVLNKNLAGVGIWALGFDGKRVDLQQLLADKFAN